MNWKSFWDRPHAVYSGPRHLAAHYRRIADDMISLLPAAPIRVLDFGCGDALEAGRVAARTAELLLFEAVEAPRARIAARFAGRADIAVLGPSELAARADASVDLVIVNSVLQYLTDAELDGLLADARRLLAPDGTLVIADVIPPDASAIGDVRALLRFAAGNGFLVEALVGLARTALSDYVAHRKALGLATHTGADLTRRLARAGFEATRRPTNLGMNPGRMTFLARPVASP